MSMSLSKVMIPWRPKGWTRWVLVGVCVTLGLSVGHAQGGFTDRPLFPRNPAPPRTLSFANVEGITKTLPGCPEYSWWYGCSPTAGGMIIGWWDAQSGCGDLFEGSAATWYGSGTSGTKRMVASQAHIDAGKLLGLTYGSYENHTADCIADFLRTRDGSTSRSNIGTGLVSFAAWNDPTTSTDESFVATYQTKYTSGGWTYAQFCAEIDAGRPVHLGLTSSAGGHSVAAIGYDNTDGKQNYICWTTWGGWGVRSWGWETENESGYNFKVYAGTYLTITPRSVTNNPPSAPTTVSISPSTPNTNSDLTAVASGSTDPDGDSVSYEYQWARSTDGGSTWSAWGWDGAALDKGYTARDELWKAQARAKDGKGGYSAWTASTVVSITNSAPTLPTTVAITPGAPSTTQDLIASASGSTDADGDSVLYVYQWARSTDGGSSWSTWDYVGATLAADNTVRGEQWKVRVQASDGSATSNWLESSVVSIVNTAPTAPTALVITPTMPVAGETLVASASGSSDVDNDSLNYEYQWACSSDNGSTWSAWSYDGSMLAGSNTGEGQLWKARARATDGTDTSAWWECSPVTVGNAPPSAPTAVAIKPLKPKSGQDLVAKASGSTDVDGDTVTYRYTWAKSTDGGKTWSGWAWAGTVLPGANTAKGQCWKVRARAFDGSVTSTWVEGATVTIANSAPTSPTKVKISPTKPQESQELRASAEGATDPDGDTITYRYAWFKSTDGGNTWQAGPLGRFVAGSLTRAGELWRVHVRAYDGTTASAWTISDAETVLEPPGEAFLLTASAANTPGNLVALTVNLTAAAEVQAAVLNLAGREVGMIPQQSLAAGVNTVWWNGRSKTGTKVPGGQYLLRIQARQSNGSCTTCLVPWRK